MKLLCSSNCVRRRTAAAAAIVLAAAAGAMAHPRPSAIPQRWELEFEPGPLRLYVDPDLGESYWYFTYVVTNRTGREQVWAPTFTLYTDAGEILASGRGVPSAVNRALIELLGNELLETQNEIIGEIFYGREFAKEGLVVWPAQHLEVNEMSLFVAGTSGETATVVHPVTRATLVLRKTLERDYLVPGDAPGRGSEPVPLVAEQWIMR